MGEIDVAKTTVVTSTLFPGHAAADADILLIYIGLFNTAGANIFFDKCCLLNISMLRTTKKRKGLGDSCMFIVQII